MKLLSFRQQGRESWGALVGERVLDLGRRLGLATLRDFLDQAQPAPARQLIERGETDLPLSQAELLPVIPRPEKILCVGINYADHSAEMNRAQTPFPTLFIRFANTLVGHGAPLVQPTASRELDYEAELAVVIGRRARHLSRAEALNHVAGYTCFNDATARDWQRHTTQFTPGKNFLSTGALGPWLVTPELIPDPSRLTLSLRLNGERMQHATTDRLLFDVPALLEYITAFTELVPGDVIATGTPGGVGSKRTPPVFLKPGDTVEVELSDVGVLRNPVVAEAPAR